MGIAQELASKRAVELKLMKLRIEKEVRAAPIAHGIPGKITEARITSAVELHPDVITKSHAASIARLAEARIESQLQRLHIEMQALEMLVNLTLAHYE